jgi:hypothetical protein
MSQYIRIFVNSICRFLNFLELDDKITECYSLCRTDKFTLIQVPIRANTFERCCNAKTF